MYAKIMTVLGVSPFDTFFFVLACYGLGTVSVHEEYAAVITALWVGVLYRATKELVLRSVVYDQAIRRLE